MFLDIQIDLIVLKTDDKQFTLTTKKNHCISPLTTAVNAPRHWFNGPLPGDFLPSVRKGIVWNNSAVPLQAGRSFCTQPPVSEH